MNKFIFVGFLYLIGVAFTVLGAVDLYDRVKWSRARSGTMSSTDPAVARMAKFSPGDGTYADLVYTTAKGTIAVPHSYVSGDVVKRLANGETIPVRFLGDHPKGGRYDGYEPESSLGWFLFGLISLGVAIVAHRMLRKEAAEA